MYLSFSQQNFKPKLLRNVSFDPALDNLWNSRTITRSSLFWIWLVLRVAEFLSLFTCCLNSCVFPPVSFITILFQICNTSYSVSQSLQCIFTLSSDLNHLLLFTSLVEWSTEISKHSSSQLAPSSLGSFSLTLSFPFFPLICSINSVWFLMTASSNEISQSWNVPLMLPDLLSN